MGGGAARFLWAPPIRLILSALFLSLFSLPVAAAEPATSGDILWLVDGSTEEAHLEVLAGVDEALSAEREGHLLGADDLLARVREGDAPLPACVTGVEPCPSAETMAFDLLDMALVIRLGVGTQGDEVEINYEMVDRRGEIATAGVLQADSGRQAGFEAVRQLFDAVGVVSFDSEPSGAQVFVDGEEVGTTPLSRQFGVGSYEYRMELDAYDGAAGTFEVRTGEAHRVSLDLVERPGRLRVRGAPAQSTVYVDGEPFGRAGELIELTAGDRVVEIRADGFQTHRTTLEVRPGEVSEVEASMGPMPGILREMEASELAANRFQLDLGVEGGGQRGVFHGASGSFHDETVRVQGWLDDGELVDGGQARALLMSGGLRLSASYEGEHFGLGLLSLSYAAHSGNLPIRMAFLADGDSFDARMTGATSLQVRPMQVRYRTFYENLAPFAQAGLGVAFHWLQVDSPEFGSLTLRQAEAFAAFEVGTRYHFDARWSVGGAYRLQTYFSGAMGVEHSLGLSLGFGFRDLPWGEPQPPEQL